MECDLRFEDVWINEISDAKMSSEDALLKTHKTSVSVLNLQISIWRIANCWVCWKCWLLMVLREAPRYLSCWYSLKLVKLGAWWSGAQNWNCPYLSKTLQRSQNAYRTVLQRCEGIFDDYERKICLICSDKASIFAVAHSCKGARPFWLVTVG